MATTQAHQIRRITIDPVTYSPAYPAMDCNKLVLSRGSNDGFFVRTDPNDIGTEIEVAAGYTYPMVANTGTFTTGFSVATPACWVRAKSSAGYLIIESTR
jgi:hypothetical protein